MIRSFSLVFLFSTLLSLSAFALSANDIKLITSDSIISAAIGTVGAVDSVTVEAGQCSAGKCSYNLMVKSNGGETAMQCTVPASVDRDDNVISVEKSSCLTFGIIGARSK